MHAFQIRLDDFTYHSLKDMAAELYDGSMAKAVRESVKKALEDWDKEHA